jgi:glucosamine--fructose-6-phosphate aminotransferase (isomerizing)
MCGIVAAVSNRNIVPLLVEGLRRLEYRGYDSCGLAIIQDGHFHRARTTSRVSDLALQTTSLASSIGIAHTRWATHGKPDTANAHPHFSNDLIGLVHNGIIENYESLRNELKTAGYEFISETDTEVIAHLIHQAYTGAQAGDLLASVQAARNRLQGAYAIAVGAADQPNMIVGARVGSPLVIAHGTDEKFLASDALALTGNSQQIQYLENGDVVQITQHSCKIFDLDNQLVDRSYYPAKAYGQEVELGPYRHYMQKEIFEQPQAIANTLEGIQAIHPELFGEHAKNCFGNIQRILILACGSSYYAGCVARYWLEAIAKIPAQVEIASEYRYRDSICDPHTLIIVISQSGETADTLAALRHAQGLGHPHTLAICNVSGSAMLRETALSYLTRAGTEIGVASTKAFTTQLVALYLLTLVLAKERGHLTQHNETEALQQLRRLPMALQAVLALEPTLIAWAEEFANKENALFLGRGLHYPIALEGALKLKEISYIHGEAYPAGELKHGPLALVTEQMPVVTVAPNDQLLEKLKSNMHEVRARGGILYVCADSGVQINASEHVRVLHLPEHYGMLSPVLHTVPLQLLAYHTACMRGTDVDKPRNLAKSVTVE